MKILGDMVERCACEVVGRLELFRRCLGSCLSGYGCSVAGIYVGLVILIPASPFVIQL
jgi:hypothetical protein